MGGFGGSNNGNHTLHLVSGVPVRCGNTVKAYTRRYGTIVTMRMPAASLTNANTRFLGRPRVGRP